MHILVVEDEIKMARALREGLEEDRYEVSVVHTGEETGPAHLEIHEIVGAWDERAVAINNPHCDER